MSIELRVPDLGEAVETATLSVWLKQEGDAVQAGEPIVEVETEKTSVEIGAPVSGVLQKVHVEAGTDGLKPGRLLATIGEQAVGVDPPPSAPPEPQGGAVDDATSDPGGVESGPSNVPNTSAHTSRSTEDTPARRASAPAASPMARRMAAAAGLELADIPGSGRGGRIGKADVERAIAARRDAGSAPAASPGIPVAPETKTPVGPVASPSFEERPLSTMRRVTARRIQEAKQTIPHFYLRVECTVDAALEMRTTVNQQNPDLGVSFTDIVVRAAALALRKVPQANSTWAESGIRVYDTADIAVAVNTPSGLITPIVREADRKDLGTISQELKALTSRARAGDLKPSEYTGGTFTISNLGMYGVESLYAIVNLPQSCILGVGAAIRRPVVIDDGIAIRTVSACTLSADHRAIDGVTGAELLAAFRMFMEDPSQLVADA